MIDALQSGWVLSWKNIITEQYVGDSHGYACDQTAVGTTNGAGGRNVQLFMLAPDGTVLHVLPGFWHPEDLLAELAFAEQLLALWQDPTLPVWIKRQAAALAQQGHAAAHDHDTQARSRWQGFDAKNELKRYEQLGDRDTLRRDHGGHIVTNKQANPQLKTLDVLMHDRMTQRPFLPFEAFDTAVFADYGRRYYDNNKKVDGEGETFMTPSRVAKREAKLERQRRREAKQAEKQRQRRERELQRAERRRAKQQQREAREAEPSAG